VKYLASISIVLALTSLTAAVGCHARSNDGCGVKILSSTANPENGQNSFLGLNAEVISEDCGATIANIKSVRLLETDGRPLGEGGGKVFSVQHGDPSISVHWQDKDTLRIDCPDCKEKDVFLRVVKKNFTNIVYAIPAQEK
jgi:hypothetical protein